MWRILADPEAAPDPKVRATLRFLRKMTLEPGAIGPDDARAVLASGVSKAALRDAIHVAYVFNVMDRLADTMGWEAPDADHGSYVVGAKMLLERGYGR